MTTDLRDQYLVYHDEYYRTIAYYNGKRIVLDARDNLYYEIIPRSSMSVNDLLNRDRITPIEDLPKWEQADIREYIANNWKDE